MWVREDVINLSLWYQKITRLLFIKLTSGSNLSLIEFTLIWPMITLKGFWFLRSVNFTKIVSIFINYDRVRKLILWFFGGVMFYFFFRIRRHMTCIYVFYRPSKFPNLYQKNLKLICFYLLNLSVILSVQDVLHWCCYHRCILILNFPDVF